MSETLTSHAVTLSVTVDGVPVPGAERLELLQCGHFAADRFRVMLAMNAMQGGAAFYAALQTATVTIGINLGTAAFPGGSADTILIGRLDNVVMDFGAGQVVLSGRDLSARLIDAEVQQTFSNRTASQIAWSFASDAGLSENVTVTKTPVGQYYELAHVRTGLGAHTRHMTRWDLLAALAEIERFSLSVTGTVLNFGPVPQAAPVLLNFGRDLVSLSVDRALGLIEPKVTVKSWNPKLKQAFSSSAGSTGGVTLVRPNLMQAEVDRLAASRQAELAGQAVLARATMPGEFLLRPDRPVFLQGTGTALDGKYIVRTVERFVDMREGFIQRFEAVQVV
ncbi:MULTISPECIES: hypothetical protein [Acidiphilium]|uniref:Phage protein D n=1 Tax=Acidiphilium iwatense TaxID=768198 RepID=A0ABS9DU40_9PROT|nr:MULTISPECIES: hypothetical protein [Acidiphilium]MCF3945310.1 hypothetical protein [Acidiphilium iwatense]